MASRRKRFFLIALCGAAPLLLVWCLPTWMARRAFAFEVERAKAEGIPLKFADLPAGPNVTLDDNAAPDYEAAIARFVEPTMGVYSSTTTKEDPRYRREVHANFVKNREAVELLIRGAGKPHCNFGYVWPRDGKRHISNLTKLKSLFMVVRNEALTEADEGHPIAALGLLSQVSRIGFHIGETPTSICLLTGALDAYMVCNSVRKILNLHGREVGVPAAALLAAGGCEFSPDLRLAIELDNVATMAGLTDGPSLRADEAARGALARRFESMSEASGRPSAPKSGISPLVVASYIPGAVDRWRTAQWKLARAELKAVRGFTGDWIGLERELSSAYRGSSGGVTGLYTLRNEADMADYADEVPRIIANRRVTLQAVAVLSAWNKTGVVPSALPLKGEDALDPRTRSSLHYSIKANGFQIYAVGDRGVDHGGDPTWDVVFEYPSWTASSYSGTLKRAKSH